MAAVPDSPPAPRPTRRTRIVCISDTHNATVKLPKGDVLIHAGDLTNKGGYSELSKAVQWLEKADFEAKIVIAGNHDTTLDRDFYLEHGSDFHNQPDLNDPAKCLSLLTSSSTITYLQHSSATVRLTRPDGPGTEFTVFGSPYSPQYRHWAFMYPRPTAAALWAAIPPDTDILVTHTPPRGHCDGTHGCDDLQTALAGVRPRLHVCGHVHPARGARRVRWDTDGPGNAAATEAGVEPWRDPHPDPASARISLVDLTARGGNRPLDFEEEAAAQGGRPGLPDPAGRVSCGGSASHPGPGSQDGVVGLGPPTPPGRGEGEGGPGLAPEIGPGSPGRADRAGRRETCVVNAAIVATAWPHVDGRRFNKPIVVDIDLPVWR